MDRPLQYFQFSGKEEDFAVWQERFEGFCFTKKLLNVLNGTDSGSNDKKYEIWAYLLVSRQLQYPDADERLEG